MDRMMPVPIESTPLLIKPAYWIIGLIGALVPLVYRKGLSKFQAGVMAICGAVGAAVFTPIVAGLLAKYVDGGYEHVEYAVAFTCGLLMMRACEVLLIRVGEFVNKSLTKLSYGADPF